MPEHNFHVPPPSEQVNDQFDVTQASATLNVYVGKGYTLGQAPEWEDKNGVLHNYPATITIGTATRAGFLAATEYTVPFRSVWCKLAEGKADYLLHVHCANAVADETERNRLNRDLAEIVNRWLAE